MIFIAMLLGLRCSEILGLRWEDFDIKRRADTDEIFTGGARRLLPGRRRPLCHPERWNRKLVSWPLWNRVKNVRIAENQGEQGCLGRPPL
jgi:integrase